LYGNLQIQAEARNTTLPAGRIRSRRRLHDLDGSTLASFCASVSLQPWHASAGNANLGLIRGVHADVASTVRMVMRASGGTGFAQLQVELESVAHPTGPVVNLQMLLAVIHGYDDAKKRKQSKNQKYFPGW